MRKIICDLCNEAVPFAHYGNVSREAGSTMQRTLQVNGIEVTAFVVFVVDNETGSNMPQVDICEPCLTKVVVEGADEIPF